MRPFFYGFKFQVSLSVLFFKFSKIEPFFFKVTEIEARH